MHSPTAFLLLVLVSVSISGVHLNKPKPHKEVIEVIEVQEVVKPEKHEHHHVKPVKHEHHVKPVEAVPYKHVVDIQAIKQTAQRLWPLFCFIPKAYHLYKPLKIKCPKLLAATTAQIAQKMHAQLIAAQARPIAVEAKPVVVHTVKVKV